VVFGGSTQEGNVNETWSFDLNGRQWTRLEVPGAPSPRNGMMGAYIPEENRFIVFGGNGSSLLNDVWELKGPAPQSSILPEITAASVQGKKLIVTGKNFDDGARVLINGERQKTKNDLSQPGMILTSKKGGKQISPGQTVVLQVRNSDGSVSPAFSFTRPVT
jgi:hypothetical protein